MRLSGAQVVVWGVGRHGGGLAAARHCARAGAQVRLLDALAPSALPAEAAEAAAAGWDWACGAGDHPWLADADLIVCSPAIPPRALPPRALPLTCPEALFFAAHHGPRVAVTGTKGKSTTVHLLATLLGWQSAGNSGRPLLDGLHAWGPAAPVVCELSSFQLWHLRRALPRFTAGITGPVTVDHLDWHPDRAHYQAAKALLRPVCDWHCGVTDCPVVLRNGLFVHADGRSLALRSDLPLPGAHMAANACRALACALALGAEVGHLATRLAAIGPLPHRLEPVCTRAGLMAIDDSAATNPLAAQAALAACAGPLAVIAGGSDKGADPDELVAAWAQREVALVLLGANADTLAARARMAGLRPQVVTDMNAACRTALALLGGQRPATILLSPGCASFGMFRDCAERGQIFADCVRRLIMETAPACNDDE